MTPSVPPCPQDVVVSRTPGFRGETPFWTLPRPRLVEPVSGHGECIGVVYPFHIPRGYVYLCDLGSWYFRIVGPLSFVPNTVCVHYLMIRLQLTSLDIYTYIHMCACMCMYMYIESCPIWSVSFRLTFCFNILLCVL